MRLADQRRYANKNLTQNFTIRNLSSYSTIANSVKFTNVSPFQRFFFFFFTRRDQVQLYLYLESR